MLSLLKKSGPDKAAAVAIPWRPDFRDISRLPDTKTVRTTFFVNALALAVTSALALMVAQREWAVASLEHSLADVEERLTAATPSSQKAVATYKLFQAEEAKFNEAYALVSDPFRVQDFLTHLGSVLPVGVSITRVEFRGVGQTVFVTSAVKGIDAAASDVATNFVKQLQSDADFARHFGSIALTNLGRNPEEGRLNLELLFTFKKPEPAAPAKK